jgi:hypothetical protein
MTYRMKLVAASALLVVSMALPALADGKKDCTTEPQASWKPAADAEAAAKAAGYEVRKSKVEGTCYEVYAVKDGKNLELFYHPIDLKLLHTVVK